MTDQQLEDYFYSRDLGCLTPKQFQTIEKEYLDILGYCKKVKLGIDNLTINSGERALWELVQNARDMGESCRIHIELTEDSIVFQHYGKPFSYSSLLALVKQDSSKDDSSKDLAGQYGTGFMTTHAFNRVVDVFAPYEVRKSKTEVDKYINMHIVLDRSKTGSLEAYKEMNRELVLVENMCESSKVCQGDAPTIFKYKLTQDLVETVSNQIKNVSSLMPFVLIINERIKEVEIYDKHRNEHYVFRKSPIQAQNSPFGQKGWHEIIAVVNRVDLLSSESKSVPYNCHYLLSDDKEDIVIIPPFPSICDDVEKIPSLFLWFPLLGTEQFGVNFIFHSKKFYPVEKRNNIQLSEDVSSKKESGEKNEKILKNMMEALFDFYQIDGKEADLNRDFCKVDFIKETEDEVQKLFYNEMQTMWNNQVINWKVIPTAEGRKSITDSRVRLLHRDFYANLNDEKREKYETTLAKFASYVKDSNGQEYLLPTTDLIKWSELVEKWGYENTESFFITLNDVCRAIKDKSDNLFEFLQFLKDSGNESLYDSYALIPNRAGTLCLRQNLRHGDFMNDQLYKLTSPLMGDDAAKMLDITYLSLANFTEYIVSDLHNAIMVTMSKWRRSSLDQNVKQPLTEKQVTALIDFCSATSQDEFTNFRGKIMTELPTYYGKKFSKNYLPKQEDKEEDFYSSAFSLLIDYTLYQISTQDENWVKENKSFLLRFLTEYAKSTDTARKDKLDTYGVIPCQKGYLCVKKELVRNDGIIQELAAIYNSVMGKDLQEKWIDTDFENLYTDFNTQTPNDIAPDIQTELVKYMKDINTNGRQKDKSIEGIIRQIILKFDNEEGWDKWFTIIDEKKAKYTFDMASGEAQKGIFSIMDMDDKDIKRLAALNENGALPNLITQMERQKELDDERQSTFNFCYRIGKAIEDRIREKLGNELLKVQTRENIDDNMCVNDIQNGQDMIISYDGKDIYYVEVKAKWNFEYDNYAHMSTNQVRMAASNPSCYALCCVDLSDSEKVNIPADSSIEYIEEHEAEIFAQTKVHLNIGDELKEIMTPILNAESDTSGRQIKLGDYRANISKTAFTTGVEFENLIEAILDKCSFGHTL